MTWLNMTRSKPGLDLLGVGDEHLGRLCVALDPGLAQPGIAVGQDDGAEACLGQDLQQPGLDVALLGLAHIQQRRCRLPRRWPSSWR